MFLFLDFAVVPLLGVIMLGMGATLSGKDFLLAFKKPQATLLGVALQFLLMPLLAFAIGHLLKLPRDQFAGLVMVGAVAGGTASNVITYLAGGDVALSITMTACSTAAGVVLTPLLAQILLAQTVEVPAWEMFKSILLMVALPVSLGLVINRVFRKHIHFIETVSPIISAIGIVLVIGIVVSLNSSNLQSCGLLVLSAVVLHNFLGMLSGYLLAKLCRCSSKTAITIAIEVGMQNSGLAAALAKTFFGAAATLPGAIFSVWHNISGALLAALYKSCSRNSRSKLTASEQAEPEDPAQTNCR
jgi:BASS family bile acid:Na+ symporter